MGPLNMYRGYLVQARPLTQCPGQRTGPDHCLEEVWVKKLPCHSHRWAFSAPGTTSSTPALNNVDKENLSRQRSGPPWREGQGSL